MAVSNQRAGAGSTGYQPVPSGNLPDGMAARDENETRFKNFKRVPHFVRQVAERGRASRPFHPLPENVNYTVKNSFLVGFLESVPEVSAKAGKNGRALTRRGYGAEV